MIKEKNIKRLPEHDEVLKRGFNLILIRNSTGAIIETIKHNKEEFVAEASTRSYMNGTCFITHSLLLTEEIPWFDIQPPKMRKMTLIEAHDYLLREKKLLCRKDVNGGVRVNTNMSSFDLDRNYEKHGTLNPDGTFKPLPLIEDK